MIYLDDISDKSTDTWKTGLELSEDGDSIFSRLIVASARSARYSPLWATTQKNSTKIITQC
jgi:hypothetical protein